jgi:exosortase/archaeosortase family protein
MIGLLFGELKHFTVARRAALVAVAIALSVVANFFRAFFLVLLAARDGVSAMDRWHDFAGYSIVAIVFVGTMGAAALLSKVESKKSKVENKAEARRNESGFTSPFLTSTFYFQFSPGSCWWS